ncbi:MAG TPA: hypothetical protein V6D13_15765 [Halomicronema sp.]
MKLDEFTLAQTMAFLILIPPESNLAKLLNFCLTVKVREKSQGLEVLKLAYELLKNPSNLPYWTQDIMGHDLDYSSEEWKALGAMKIKDADEFMALLSKELENLNL